MKITRKAKASKSRTKKAKKKIQWTAVRHVKPTKTRTTLGNPRHPPGSTVPSIHAGNSGYGKPPSKFAKGNPGKLPGTKNAIPSSIKASIRTVLEEVAQHEGHTVRKAIIGGLQGGPRNADRYIRLIAEYVDGKPVDTLNLNQKFTDEELASAKSRLDRKVASLVKTIINKRKRDAEDAEKDNK